MLPTLNAREAVNQYHGIGSFNCEGFHYTYGDNPGTLAAVSMRGDIFTCDINYPRDWLTYRMVA